MKLYKEQVKKYSARRRHRRTASSRYGWTTAALLVKTLSRPRSSIASSVMEAARTLTDVSGIGAPAPGLDVEHVGRRLVHR